MGVLHQLAEAKGRPKAGDMWRKSGLSLSHFMPSDQVPTFLISQKLEFIKSLEILNTMKSDLRQKYINEIDAIQRSTATDPDTWVNLEPTMAQIAKLNQL